MTLGVATGPGATAAHQVAGVDRRFYAFVIDRLVTWPLLAVAAWAGYRLHWQHGRFWAGLALLAGVAAALALLTAAALAWRGATPGKAALGLRVVREDGGTLPLGPAALRSVVLGLAGLPTFGLGLAGLAQSAVLDPTRRRRGWHDRVGGSVVVDVRPPAQVEAEVAEPPRAVVNLTTMRLATGSAAPEPRRAAAMAPHPVPDPAPPATVPGPRWVVAFDTGETLQVEGLTLLGRRPEGRPGETVRRAVALPSEDLSLSKTHAQLHVDADGALLVTDRGSTNGSALVRGGAARELVGGRPEPLLPGDTVVLGDRRFTVAHGS